MNHFKDDERDPFSEALREDWERCRPRLTEAVRDATILVIGGAGTIGSACVRALLEFLPRRIDVVDIDENGLARFARDIRSRHLAGLQTHLRFLPMDFGSWPARAYVAAGGPYELALNLAAVKHVRSEKNLHTLLHMIDTNVIKQHRFFQAVSAQSLVTRYFVVSTDKAADPASFMGATKRLLEAVILADGVHQDLAGKAPIRSAARFANVAFSTGSLLESYIIRLQARRPLAAPADTRRYFISDGDAARICLLSACLGDDGLIAIPAIEPGGGAIELADTAAAFLRSNGLKPVFVQEPEAAEALLGAGGADYPIVLTPRDTAGEKDTEVFVGAGERTFTIGLGALQGLRPSAVDPSLIREVVDALAACVEGRVEDASIAFIGDIVRQAIPSFVHATSDLTLDDRL